MGAYRISRNHEVIERMPAPHIEAAATAYARRFVNGTATARRTTGEPGKSGYFQAYTPAGTGSLSSAGSAFHVAEDLTS